MMDIGMLAIPSHVRNKTSPLEVSEIKVLRSHTILSFRLLENFNSDIKKFLSGIALQHHEAFDGTGYPRGLKGDQIYPLATIAGTCDSYTAMIEKRPFRDAYLPAMAIRHMLSPKNISRYNPKVIRAFARELSIYPLGSFAELNDGRIVIVLASHEEAPKRPIVRVIRNSKKLPVQEIVFLDLKHEDNLRIIKPIDPRNYAMNPIEEI